MFVGKIKTFFFNRSHKKSTNNSFDRSADDAIKIPDPNSCKNQCENIQVLMIVIDGICVCKINKIKMKLWMLSALLQKIINLDCSQLDSRKLSADHKRIALTIASTGIVVIMSYALMKWIPVQNGLVITIRMLT